MDKSISAVVSDAGRSPAREANGDLLPAATSMDAVTLHVGDLEKMVAYYRDALALDVLARDGRSAVLGHTSPLVVLLHQSGLPVPSRREAGLFHTALLFETQQRLAATVLSAAQRPDSQYVGSADHLVSKAFYFTDPEGNGIELYWDRPRSEWIHDGAFIRMASDPLDPGAFLGEHLDRTATNGSGVEAAEVGHVHLQVGDIDTARGFYVDTLGFETTAEMPSALFVSAGGYHHHMAMNVWNSRGAGPRAATLGLGQVSIAIPTRDDIESLIVRLRHYGVSFRDDGDALAFDDPWKNLIEVTPADHRR